MIRLTALEALTATRVARLKKDGLLVVQTRGRGDEFPWHQFNALTV